MSGATPRYCWSMRDDKFWHINMSIEGSLHQIDQIVDRLRGKAFEKSFWLGINVRSIS